MIVRTRTAHRFALAGALLLLVSACVNTPSGYRPAPVFDQTSLFTADPAVLKFAVQSNVKPGTYTLEWTATRDADGSVLADDSAVLERLAAGREAGFGLPAARDGQTWSVWALDESGRARLRALQETVRAARMRDEKLAFSVHWNFDLPEPLPGMPDVVYMTYALRLSDDGRWLTLMDNLAVIPDDNTDDSRAD